MIALDICEFVVTKTENATVASVIKEVSVLDDVALRIAVEIGHFGDVFAGKQSTFSFSGQSVRGPLQYHPFRPPLAHQRTCDEDNRECRAHA